MDNQKNPELPEDDHWLDELLSSPEVGDELGPDEHAVSSAGLTHPNDAELERIIQETKSQDFDAPLEPVPEEAPFRDEEYRDTFGEGADLAAVFSDEPMPETPEQAPAENDGAQPRKGRPRRKKGYGLLGLPHILATFIWFAIAVTIGVCLGRTLWVCAADMLAFGRQQQSVTVTITESDNIDTIAAKLKNAGLIEYPDLFKYFVRIKGDENALIPGTFTLDTLYDYNALVNAMKPHKAAREEIKVIIPEGYTCAQIFALLEEKGVCSAADLEAYAADGKLSDYWFLEGVERGSRYCLEGYLFPDTYQFYTNDEPSHVLHKMLDAFDARFTDLMKERLVTINERFSQQLRDNGYSQEYIDAHQLTLHDIVTIASIVEKEAANIEHSYTVASVFYNRLADPKAYPYLQSDATVYYAIGGASNKELTAEDKQVDSPYNSYIYAGLIPGPISNPGQAILNAALDPENSDYYFFFYDAENGIHFAETYDEHIHNIQKYGES